MFAPEDCTIKSQISYIHFYREWLCNGKCVTGTGLIETPITVEQTACFSLLSRKKLSNITATPFHRLTGRHYLWPWTEHCYHSLLEKHNNEWFVTYTAGAIFLKSCHLYKAKNHISLAGNTSRVNVRGFMYITFIAPHFTTVCLANNLTWERLYTSTCIQ